MVIEKKVMATKKFKIKFNKLQQEQRDLDASYRQSLKNKKERDKTTSELLREGYEEEKKMYEEQEDNEEYLKQLKDKLRNGINYTSTRRRCGHRLKVEDITR